MTDIKWMYEYGVSTGNAYQTSWSQKYWPNWDIPYTGGWCLSYVDNAYISAGANQLNHVYPTATAWWNGAKKKHLGVPPLGIEVPIYFTLVGEPAGHAAIRRADGSVVSASQSGNHQHPYVHKSIQDLLNFYGTVWDIKYIGWAEDVRDNPVVNQVATHTEYSYNPNSNVTRQQMAMFLYRLAGKPAFTPSSQDINRFTDLNGVDEQFKKAIYWLNHEGITTGVDSNRFNPNGSVTRAQMASFMYRLANSPIPVSASGFTDISGLGSDFATAINWLKQVNVTTGLTSTKFNPKGAVTREQMAAFMHRLYCYVLGK
ncbi:MAG: S-layer homology domain-containing protein [Candidatus Ancillula sp.]|jgi:hypothetical protein|nr:S-layer homology domain-containing protein [Candidatus Ancillula sp.]